MGYKREPKEYRLKFDDGDMAGFEVTMRGLSSEKFLDLTEAATHLSGLDARDVAAVGAAAPMVGIMFGMLGDNLIGWNLEDDNGPVAATKENLLRQDFAFVLQIGTAWMDAIASVPPPLPASSNGGAPSPGLSIPMEPLSPSRSS